MTDEQKNCPYCHGEPSQTNLITADMRGFTIVYVSHRWLRIEGPLANVGTTINFCPMCGRNLRGGNND